MALDLRPRIVFHTSLGAVVTVLDPATPFGGVIQVPGVGNVPYDVDWTAPSMTVHLPTYGDQVIPLIPTGGPSSFSIPGLGDVTYEVVFGPVDIPPEQLAPTGALALGFNPWIIGIGAVAIFLLWPKRNPVHVPFFVKFLDKNPKKRKRRRKKYSRIVAPELYFTEAQWRRVEEINRMLDARDRRSRFHVIKGWKNPRRRKKWDVGERVEFRRTRRRLTLPPHRHLNPCPCGFP